MELRRLSADDLALYLETRAPEIRDLGPGEREAVFRMARRLVDRDLAPRFILAAVHNTVHLLRVPATVSVVEAPPPESLVSPMAETRRLSARRLAESTRDLLREARSARRSNEVRKMRGVLRSIDQGKLRESLGDEGAHLCEEIDHVLLRLAYPVRRGRPRTQRVGA